MLTTVCASDYDDMSLAELMKRGLLGPNVENTGQARVDPLAVTRGRLQPRMQKPSKLLCETRESNGLRQHGPAACKHVEATSC